MTHSAYAVLGEWSWHCNRSYSHLLPQFSTEIPFHLVKPALTGDWPTWGCENAAGRAATGRRWSCCCCCWGCRRAQTPPAACCCRCCRNAGATVSATTASQANDPESPWRRGAVAPGTSTATVAHTKYTYNIVMFTLRLRLPPAIHWISVRWRLFVQNKMEDNNNNNSFGNSGHNQQIAGAVLNRSGTQDHFTTLSLCSDSTPCCCTSRLGATTTRTFSHPAFLNFLSFQHSGSILPRR